MLYPETTFTLFPVCAAFTFRTPLFTFYQLQSQIITLHLTIPDPKRSLLRMVIPLPITSGEPEPQSYKPVLTSISRPKGEQDPPARYLPSALKSSSSKKPSGRKKRTMISFEEAGHEFVIMFLEAGDFHERRYVPTPDKHSFA